LSVPSRCLAPGSGLGALSDVLAWPRWAPQIKTWVSALRTPSLSLAAARWPSRSRPANRSSSRSASYRDRLNRRSTTRRTRRRSGRNSAATANVDAATLRSLWRTAARRPRVAHGRPGDPTGDEQCRGDGGQHDPASATPAQGARSLNHRLALAGCTVPTVVCTRSAVSSSRSNSSRSRPANSSSSRSAS
jgi:hypothetical protein